MRAIEIRCMKTLTILSVLTASATLMSASAQTIAQWTFETSPPADLTDSTTIGGIAADFGLGTASGVHASALSDWTTPAGNGSANSLSVNTWGVGDYFQFSVSTLGFQNIGLSWAQTSSSTGPGEFKLAYQVNGGGFTDFMNYTVLPNSATPPGAGNWSVSTENLAYNFFVDLSSVSALNNATAIDFRLIMAGTADATPPGDVAPGGTDRVDNVTVAVVPEPTSLAIVGGLTLLFCRNLARRR